MTLTKEQLKWLKWLYDNGESGWLDQYGRVIANGANSHQGSQVSWLNLVTKGLLEGREGRLHITQAGYKQLLVDMDKRAPIGGVTVSREQTP